MFYVIKQKQNKRLARIARQALILLLFYYLYFAWWEFTLSMVSYMILTVKIGISNIIESCSGRFSGSLFEIIFFKFTDL